MGHFRNAGIAIPGGLAEADLIALDKIIRQYDIDEIFILGDLFHSGLNYDIRLFDAWREVHHAVDLTLVKGNHDIMSDQVYTNFDIKLFSKYFLWNRFLFTHKPFDPNVVLNGCDYIFSGHVHPGVRLEGRGKQSVSLPCFHFIEKQCILPAFGEFTGKHIIKPNGKDMIFVIAQNDKEQVVIKVDKN